MKVWMVIAAGFVVHGIFFFSIFEIYFTSPLVNGMTPHNSPLVPPAKRLVFIVADGLRANKILELTSDGKTPAPFLRHIIKTTGLWGISHAAVPTATRPGHVALTAGFYEDPTSVAKDLQGKDVFFDTVFNESRFIWSWDTPKFLAKVTGGNADRMFSQKYPGDMKWLAGINAEDMDSWVFNEANKLFDDTKTDPILKGKMDKDQILFFLHLGGLDHSGYIVRPNSHFNEARDPVPVDGSWHTNAPNLYDLVHGAAMLWMFGFDDERSGLAGVYTFKSYDRYFGYAVVNAAWHREAYLDHISFVDEGIKKLFNKIENHYNHDGKTAYVFTSDHGMTDWGAHGDGTQDETQTPLVAWGPGIRKPEPETTKYPDGLSEAWSLSTVRRTDIMQASMTPFLAALIGIPFPMNAVLPVPDNLFNLTGHEMAEMLFANMRQLLAQCEKMREERERTSIKIAYKPFEPLSPQNMVTLQDTMQSLIIRMEYNEAIEKAKTGIHLAVEGIRYYTTYDRNYLWLSVVSSYIGWIVYVLSLLYEENNLLSRPNQVPQLSIHFKGIFVAFFSLLAVTIFIILYVQSSIWTIYFYVLLPCPIWMAVCLRLNILKQMASVIASTKRIVPYILLALSGLECVVLSYYHREVMSLVLACFAAVPWLFKSDIFEKRILLHWSVSCLCVAFFPLIPTDKRQLNFNLVVLGGVLIITVACFIVKTFAYKQLARSKLVLIFGVQICIIAVSVLIVRHTAEMAATNRRTPFLSQSLSWIFLVLGVIEPFLVTTNIRCRLLTICLAWMSPVILFSISYECLFMVSMCWNMYIWMVMEANYIQNNEESITKLFCNNNSVNGKASPVYKHRLLEDLDFATVSSQLPYGKCRQSLVLSDIHRAFYFIFLATTSLFGTGNIASVNSFDPAAVFCFLTVSNPPFMGSLIVLKLAIPFILIACAVRAINLITNMPWKAFIFLVLLMTSVVSFQFFLLVDDKGTWMHIGETVSHYVIFQVINMAIMLLFGLSYLLTTCKIYCIRQK